MEQAIDPHVVGFWAVWWTMTVWSATGLFFIKLMGGGEEERGLAGEAISLVVYSAVFGFLLTVFQCFR